MMENGKTMPAERSGKYELPLVLASASPRRRELMGYLNRPFEIMVSDAEEKLTTTNPAKAVMELSRQKAENVAQKLNKDSIVIGADTVVACDGAILGKPKDRADALRMLRLLSGRTHSVFTGVTLFRVCAGGQPLTESFYEETRVTFYPMTQSEIEGYTDTGDPFDKAGAYGIQSGAAVFVKKIEGDYNNVVGLPAAALYHRLREFENRF